MDLTARDPSKVPRCILSRFAGVSEGEAERESAGEILSAASARRISALSRFAGVSEAAGRAGVRTRNPEGCKDVQGRFVGVNFNSDALLLKVARIFAPRTVHRPVLDVMQREPRFYRYCKYIGHTKVALRMEGLVAMPARPAQPAFSE